METAELTFLFVLHILMSSKCAQCVQLAHEITFPETNYRRLVEARSSFRYRYLPDGKFHKSYREITYPDELSCSSVPCLSMTTLKNVAPNITTTINQQSINLG